MKYIYIIKLKKLRFKNRNMINMINLIKKRVKKASKTMFKHGVLSFYFMISKQKNSGKIPVIRCFVFLILKMIIY